MNRSPGYIFADLQSLVERKNLVAVTKLFHEVIQDIQLSYTLAMEGKMSNYLMNEISNAVNDYIENYYEDLDPTLLDVLGEISEYSKTK